MSLPGEFVVSFPCLLANLANNQIVEATVAASAGRTVTVQRIEFVTGFAVASTSGKAATATATVNTTPVTGGACALTTAGCTPAGAVTAGSAITAGNSAAGSCTIGVKITSVTTFSQGSGQFNVYYTVA